MAKQPASIRYKNPGAMWGSPLAIKWGASPNPVSLKDGTGQNNNIAVFPTYVQGICAQLDLWRTGKYYKGKTVAEALDKWSGGNNVASYIAFIRKRVPGITKNTVLDDDFWKSDNGVLFLKAQAAHEAGKVYPAPEADWLEAQRIVFTPKPSIKGKVIAGVRAVGGAAVGGGTLAVQVGTSITGTPGETVEAVKTWTDNAGQIAGSIKTVVDYVPPTLFEKVVKFVASPAFLATALAIVLVSWGVSYWLRRNEGPK